MQHPQRNSLAHFPHSNLYPPKHSPEMFASPSLVALALAAFAAVNTVAIPAAEPRKEYPEVVPGPGLPTLAELGLTSEELYTMAPKLGKCTPTPFFIAHRELTVHAEGRSTLEARSALYNNVCQTYTTANVDNVIACFNYLQSIGGNACTVNGDNVQFCYSGNAQVTGSNISGTGSASSRW